MLHSQYMQHIKALIILGLMHIIQVQKIFFILYLCLCSVVSARVIDLH